MKPAVILLPVCWFLKKVVKIIDHFLNIYLLDNSIFILFAVAFKALSKYSGI